MKILLVGSGGREHSLAWKLAQSEKCEKLYCAPGNAGIAGSAQCVPFEAEDTDSLVHFAIEEQIDLVVIGPEAPLVLGLADRLNEAGIKVFGPSAAAARLEGSKGFMKDLCAKYDIPTAAYRRFTNLEEARKFIEKQDAPIVIKTDGLAAGKGVIIAQTKEEAIEVATNMLSGTLFGASGQEIVIEAFLEGEEVSFFALADGKTVLPLTSAQDHKRAYDGDTGPNTGGMGAYSPAHMMNPALEKTINDRIIQPAVNAMAAEGCPFTGVLFAGIMLVEGDPVLIEFNARFGDPECQTMMMRLQSDLLEILLAGAERRLSDLHDSIVWRDETALCVVMAAKGYPEKYIKNSLITIDLPEFDEKTAIFHAGTKRNAQGDLVNSGGRVLGVCALGKSVAQARKNAYETIGKVHWPEGFYRSDIGWRALQAEEEFEKNPPVVNNLSA
ncbi:MAG: phosphoribosylamine--glycine ligase [Alphaproteobacteria bacterium CG_4_9_14_3_um_filter_47_13]|nr:MAG: phosphoribosylamine--glycine ligase [Alphaproteobacteria bacterium CG_4_9_14_3_um_filter_47_13]